MVGIVIDDAIVVLENIYRFIEEKGMTPFQAAIEGTREIGLAVHGDDAVPARGLSTGRLHGRHRRSLHVFVRSHFIVCNRRLSARFVHADADARRAANQAQVATEEAGDRRAAERGRRARRLADESKVVAGEPAHSLGARDGALSENVRAAFGSRRCEGRAHPHEIAVTLEGVALLSAD